MAFNIYEVVRVACLSRSRLGEFTRELKRRRQRRLRKRHLKSEFAVLQLELYRTYSISFNSSLNCWEILLELNSKGMYQSSGKEKDSCCLVFPSSTKREIRHFHVVVVQQRHRNVHKSVIHVQSCCFACPNVYCVIGVLVDVAVVVAYPLF